MHWWPHSLLRSNCSLLGLLNVHNRSILFYLFNAVVHYIEFQEKRYIHKNHFLKVHLTLSKVIQGSLFSCLNNWKRKKKKKKGQLNSLLRIKSSNKIIFLKIESEIDLFINVKTKCQKNFGFVLFCKIHLLINLWQITHYLMEEMQYQQ